MEKKEILLLLVDTDKDYFILTREMLREIENADFHLEWAESYERAIEKIKQKRFDAYLFDFKLGDRSGLDLLQETVVIDEKTPVVMLTSNGDLDLDTRAMRAGATDYLNKRHLKPELLERTIRYAIQNKRLLYERNVLLKEVNHRIKNNFQLVSSILQLESAGISDPQALQILDDCRYRLRTIAILHEKLYMADDLTEVNAGGYIRDILADLFKSFVSGSQNIEYKLETDHVTLSIRKLLPCGIIVNELVSNALKYAFPPGNEEGPLISVALREEAGTVHLTVSDNGTGFPRDLDIRKTDSLGLKLVTILSEEQLEGRLTLEREKGTLFHIQFKK
jgi:two-component sensor histidine kinase